MHSVIINNNQSGQRLDKFLHKYLPYAGNGFLYKMLRKKNITLNGKRAEGKEILILEDKIDFFFSEETFAKFSKGDSSASNETQEEGHRKCASRQFSLGEEGRRAFQLLHGVRVLYEDENVLILDKPAGMLTQKAEVLDVSLNEWLLGYLLSKDAVREEELSYFRPSVCNRLDRNTSGIVLCGKSLAGLKYLNGCVRERTVRKFYRTICRGVIREPAVIEGFLVKDSEKNHVLVRETDKAGGALIRTAYTPLAAGKEYTLLEVELITGKPHQIRAHLAKIGHPLAGDFKYGDKHSNQILKEKYRLEHHLLHACRIEFPEETDGAGKALSKTAINAPCPKAFLKLQDELLK